MTFGFQPLSFWMKSFCVQWRNLGGGGGFECIRLSLSNSRALKSSIGHNSRSLPVSNRSLWITITKSCLELRSPLAARTSSFLHTDVTLASRKVSKHHWGIFPLHMLGVFSSSQPPKGGLERVFSTTWKHYFVLSLLLNTVAHCL